MFVSFVPEKYFFCDAFWKDKCSSCPSLMFIGAWPTEFNQVCLGLQEIQGGPFRRTEELLLAESFVLFNILWRKINRLTRRTTYFGTSTYYSPVRANIIYLLSHYAVWFHNHDDLNNWPMEKWQGFLAVTGLFK